ncbi:hypothetical protein ACMFMF_004057 [Clarireedia jacksonii]
MYRTPPNQPQNRGQAGRSTSAEQAGSPSRSASQGTTTILDTQLGTQDTLEASQATPQATHQAGDESASDSQHYSPPPAQPTTRQSHSAPVSPSLQLSQNVDAGRRRRGKGKGKAVQRAPSVTLSTDSITALIA